MLCFSVALWNEKDPVLKETLFGLSGPQGNHGEDVKEYYYYLDNLPTHSYMKMLYKYSMEEFPYQKLLDENKNRSKNEGEYELIDTGIFDDNKYFDVFIEYAKNDSEDILIRVTIFNRSDSEAKLHFIPQLWFRNTWVWGYDDYKPRLIQKSKNRIELNHKKLGKYYFYFENGNVLFCENETNKQRLYDCPNETTTKDGINDFIINADTEAVNKNKSGTKAGIHYSFSVAKNSSRTFQFRLTSKQKKDFKNNFEKIFEQRIKEADEFYSDIQDGLKKEPKEIQRKAFAGMLWNKQYYNYDISLWLKGDPAQPKPPEERESGRNTDWIHLNNEDIISMPDKWEYPWYAAWDLAFHCITLSLVDPEFAKNSFFC